MNRVVLSVFISLFVGAFAHVNAMYYHNHNYGYHVQQPRYYEEKVVVALQQANIRLQAELAFNKALLAAKNGDDQYFEEHEDHVNLRNAQGKTLLHLAAADGDEETCQFLVDCEADVNAKDNDWKTPLHDAAANGQSSVCSQLIKENKAFIDSDRRGNYPFHYAVLGGHISTSLKLLERGAGTSVNNKDYKTPRDLNPKAFEKIQNQVRIIALENRPWWQKKSSYVYMACSVACLGMLWYWKKKLNFWSQPACSCP